jgi:hypothetical protein
MPLTIGFIKLIFLDSLLSVIYFPCWWYTIGLKKRVINFTCGIKNLARNLALKIMLTHIFRPMFGEYSRSGRIISFFMRLVLLIWRSFLFLVGSIAFLFLLLLWIIAPITSVWQIAIYLF